MKKKIKKYKSNIIFNKILINLKLYISKLAIF